MNNIEVKVIADSISPSFNRITTLQVRFPRFILPEFNTHRVFSRNFSSSRAIPVKKMIEMVRQSPARPIHWGENQPGMQASKELPDAKKVAAKMLWGNAAKRAADSAEAMMELGLHKQVANRVLEPFMMVNGIVTATEFNNWFELRMHPDAQPEIQELAKQMYAVMADSDPVKLKPGEWHLPYVTTEDRYAINAFGYPSDTLMKISAARCCRVSYLKHDGAKPSIDDDLKLCERLAGARPIHASPFEHQASPDVITPGNRMVMARWKNPELHGNFVGWKQYRKYIEQSFK